MPVEFTLPELGENVEKGDVIRVLVSPGDVVKADQAVLELETDKATIEVPTSVGGTVSEVKVKPGEKISVGQVVLVLDGAPAKTASGGEAQRAVKESAPGAVSPADGGGAPAAEKKDSESAGADIEERSAAAPAGRRASDAPVPGRTEPVPELRPPAPSQPSRPAPVVDIAAARQGPVPGRVDAGQSHRETPTAGREATAPAAARATAAGAAIAAAPSVRRYARELGVNIADVSGTGPGGRIGQDDLRQFVKSTMSSSAVPGVARGKGLPDFSKWGEVEVKPMSNIRRKTAEHLSIAWQAPHVTQHDQADVTALEEFRKTYGPRVEKAGGKLTVTAIVIRILASAIAKFPQFASSVDMANETIVFKKYMHIGVAVDTPNGLLVPVIRDVDRKTITEIAVELAALSQKARDRKLTLDEMAGGVFSITNLGGIGGSFFTPIINQPEVAILGLSRTSTAPVWRGGQFVPREVLPLSLSYDHRVIDGADAARFLRFVAEALEQPLTMHL
ncbi:MAG TPA: 2-oxo acid dehydrogenase subunit E2 [Vicinamibacterales bacterium]|nr:2-oxo acid dehydrogenase subunit E2 [Vicinamibacterales bacterium]